MSTQRKLAIASSILFICAIAAGFWLLRTLGSTAYIAPGAANIAVNGTSFGEQQITYDVPPPADGWQSTIARRLSLSGWAYPAEEYGWGGTETIQSLVVYTRTSQISVLQITERAEFFGDHRHAEIHVSRRYRLNLPW